MFVDQNIFWLVTPLKIPYIDATYGAMIDVPFAIAPVSGSATLEPVLDFQGRRQNNILASPNLGQSGDVTKGSIGDIYFEPIDLGWHFKQFDALAAGGFLAPTGPYNADARFNIGFGHWTGLLGAGGILYADTERTWALSLMSHYETYASQIGRRYVLGDEAMIEWGASKTINLPNRIFQQLTIGPAGYAQWQTTDNQIQITPTNAIDSSIINGLKEAQIRIYSIGPAAMLLTKYGLFSLRYYDEFGANATPSGQQLMFSYTLAVNPFK
jgi:hypothetical protein